VEDKSSISKNVIADEIEEKVSGKDWLKYSVSVWDDSKNAEEKKLGHPASFPVDMVCKLIRLYSKRYEIILDPFNGIGSTMVAAAKLNRNGIGFDTNSEFNKITQDRLHGFDGEFKIINDTCLNMTGYIDSSTIDLCITSPPYWDVLNMKRSSDKKPISNYSNQTEDLGNISDYDRFINSLHCVFSQVYNCLKMNRHCIVIVMDIRKKSKFFPFHMDITNMMTKIGFQLEDFIIWDRRKEYNNLRPLGYPWVFRVNKVHEYICIFKKSGVKE
jgi:DNA modification methylase